MEVTEDWCFINTRYKVEINFIYHRFPWDAAQWQLMWRFCNIQRKKYMKGYWFRWWKPITRTGNPCVPHPRKFYWTFYLAEYNINTNKKYLVVGQLGNSMFPSSSAVYVQQILHIHPTNTAINKANKVFLIAIRYRSKIFLFSTTR